MTFDEWWSEYCGNDTDKSLQLGKVYAASAWDRQQKRIAELERELAALASDGTPFQSDDFTRGEDYSFRMCMHHITKILDGEDDGTGINREPWATIRKRLLALLEGE